MTTPQTARASTAHGDEAARRWEDVVARHLERFAWREPPAIRWTPDPAATAPTP